METQEKTFHFKIKASELELILEALEEKAHRCHDAGEVVKIQQVTRAWNELEAEQSRVTVQQRQADIARLGEQFLARHQGIGREPEGFSR